MKRKSPAPSAKRRRIGTTRIPRAAPATPNPAVNLLEPRMVSGYSTDWYTFLPELSPSLIRQRLYSGMFGSYGDAYDLFLMMQDTSPRLLINLHEVRENASQVDLQVTPFQRLDENPTPEAEEKAKFIDWALQQFDAEAGTDEVGMEGLGYDILADLVQTSIVEMMYYQVDGYWVPRAGAWVNPRKYGIRPDGRIGVVKKGSASGIDAAKIDVLSPYKFIVANYKTHSGSQTMSGLFRPLAPWWGMAMYGRKWMFDFAQRYGNPIPVVPYSPDIDPKDFKALQDFCANFAANAYFMYPWQNVGDKPDLWESKREAKDTPMAWLKQEYDYYCDLVILGEQRMSETGRVTDRGSTQQAAALKKVKNDRIRCVAQHRAAVLQNTLVKWLLILNYGNTNCCPTLQADIDEAQDPLSRANTIKAYREAGYKLEVPDLQKETGLPLVEVELSTETPEPPDNPNKPATTSSDKPKPSTNGNGKNGHDDSLKGTAADIMRKRGYIIVEGEDAKPEDVPVHSELTANALKDFTKEESALLLPVLSRADAILAIHDEVERKIAAEKFRTELPSILKQVLNKKAGMDKLARDITAAFFNGMAESAQEMKDHGK